jgi:hypothetical protein
MKPRLLLDKLTGWMNLRPEIIIPVVSFQYGYGTRDKPNWTNYRFSFGRQYTQSLFYNGVFYFRFMLPFCVCLMIRWTANPDGRKQFLQTLLGWKLNGVLALTFRIQNDPSAKESNKGHEYDNLGQAIGFDDGTK